VFRVCDRVTALNLGRMIAHGTSAEVRNDPDVIKVYLGA
jgi:branched-chain amino acid transport system ATP-binding protein